MQQFEVENIEAAMDLQTAGTAGLSRTWYSSES